MSTNKDLLKQAIAEAKTIREAAIANAKEALEETLTPHLKEMLAMKLQEMEDKEDGDEFDPSYDIEDAQQNIERGLYEAEEEEAEEGEAEEEGETEEGEEEDIDVKDMSVEELKDLIRDIVSQEVGHDESEEEAPEGTEDMTGMDSEEEIDINELLAELAEMDGEVEEGIGSAVRGVVKKVKDKAEKAYDAIQNAPETKFSKVLSKKIPETEPHSGANRVAEGELEEYSSGKMDPMNAFSGKETGKELDVQLVNAIKSIAAKTGKSYEAISKLLFGGKRALPSEFGSFEESIEEYSSGKMDPMNAFSGKETGKELDVQLVNAIKSIAAKTGKSYEAISKLLFGGERALPSEFGSFEESAELNEALATVRQLRNQLQEVNLLNAKLLYVNKVFKANNLTEGQKVNVVAAFDKAETVKEVKLVFETVSKNVTTKQPVKQSIREHKSFASKATGSTQKQVINEVSEAVHRMQVLAGIKQREI